VDEMHGGAIHSPDIGAGALPPRSIAVVLGTRPEIIKLGHVVRHLGASARVIHTGQHYDAGLSDEFFTAFGLPIPPEVIGIGGKSRAEQVSLALSALSESFLEERPRAVVVQGDTNSTLAAALAANAMEIPLVHVEAGLRSFDRRMPEEHNRIVTDHLADLCFAPTGTSAENLAREGIGSDRIWITGNTIVEAVGTLLPSVEARASLTRAYGLSPNGFVLSTFHRPENVDDPSTFEMILREMDRLDLPVLLPLHPRSRARVGDEILNEMSNVIVTDPLPYTSFLALLAEAAIVIGDSGGIQEEISIVKRPMIVVRRSTERPEVMGTFAALMSPGSEIAALGNEWIAGLETIHHALRDLPTPFGDGFASERVVKTITAQLLL
jgi:UDP-N-acetylglucosamine 2-epimerase (non-hydrolysing)